jgi:LCP family protein required for cell wall assembly
MMAVSQRTSQSGNQISIMVSSQNGAIPTPTPFLPLDPTPTYIPTAVPTLVPTPTPEEDSGSHGNSQPAGLLGEHEKYINILMLGSDQRIGQGGFRTDTIILVSINTNKKTVSMVSFPRDLYVYIPGWTYQRINTAMFHGGFKTLKQTLEYNFGVKPDYYILVNFSAFKDIIKTLGGLEVEVGRTFTDQYWDKSYITIPAGTVYMDSSTAMWYARTRTSSNDFDRTRRQQEILQAVAKRLVSMNAIENAKEIYDILSDNVNTNITWSDIKPLLPLAVHLRDTSQIKKYAIGPGEVYDWITPGGAMVLLPRHDLIKAMLKEALGTQ